MSIQQVCYVTRICSTPGYYVRRGREGASITVAAAKTINRITGQGCWHAPFSIYFQCARRIDTIDESMKAIYQRIIGGNAHTLLEENPHGCRAGNNTGHCGNVRKNLTECRCEILNRKLHPERRRNYENSIIQQVFNLIGTQRSNFNIHIAMLATGKLHGELCLLLRLIDALKNNGFTGHLRLSLIDTEYAESIRESHRVAHLPRNSKFQWAQLIGYRGDIEQFLTELALCLPSTITVDGEFFGSTDDYLRNAQLLNQKHDLMIGADIDGLDPLLRKVNQLARRSLLPAFGLVKRVEHNQIVARLCQIDDQEYCIAT